jgi:Mn2+/Fe2+ NRAMP family transporter
VERVFLGVMVVFLAYPVAAVLATPDWTPVARAFVTPSLSMNPTTLLLMVAVVGTTITPYMQFYLQSAVAEKGIGEEELRLEQADAVAGSVWTNLIAVFIVVAAAAATAGLGVTISSAADAAQALEPVAGPWAEALFGIGLFGASVLAATIMPISTAFVICEAFGWESGVGKRFGDAPIFFGIYTFVLAVGAVLVLLVAESALVPIIVGSQNLQGLLLPVVLVFLVLLVNDRRLMGGHANGRWTNLLAWGSVIVVIVLDAVMLGVALLGSLGVSLG